jgi:polysaccharide pyruvyl transferase WcaK-like protein
MAHPKTIKATIINYTGNQANWGCQATSIELKSELIHLLQLAFPDAPIVIDEVSLGAFRSGKSLGKIFNRFLTFCYLHKRKDFLTRQLLSFICRFIYSKNFNKVIESDVVFFQAEGTMSGKNFMQGNRLFLLPYFAKAILNKPVFSLNQTLFSLNKEFEEVIRSCYNIFDMVAVRESASLTYAHKIGIKNAFVLPDAAFNAPSHYLNHKIKNTAIDYDTQKYFCITGAEGISEERIKNYLNVTSDCIQKYNMHAVFLLSGPRDNSKFRPYAENWKLTSEDYADKIHILPDNLELAEAISILKKSCFLIGGRYHMAILAAASGKPFVLFPPRTHKSQGLLEMMDYPLPICDPEDFSEAQRQIKKIIINKEEMESCVANCIDRVQELNKEGRNILLKKLKSIAL